MNTPRQAEPSAGLIGQFDAMRPELLRFLSARSGDASLAQDLLQDLWLKISGAATGPIDNARAYLFRAANNLVLDNRRGTLRAMVRDREWAVEGHGATDAEATPDPTPAVDELLVRQEEIDRLRAAVNQLPPGAAQALRLFRFEGLSQKEVAARMGISLSGVEKHLSLAMRTLRSTLIEGNATTARDPRAAILRTASADRQRDISNDRG